jgi:hypothetical protein
MDFMTFRPEEIETSIGSNFAFKTIVPASGENVVADTKADTLTLATTSFMTVAGTAISDTITFTVQVKDEDDMISDSAIHLSTQQSIKAYVDALSTSSDREVITQAGHGFAAKDVIRCSGTDTYAKAQADSVSNAESLGIVESVDGNDFEVVWQGRISDITGLTANTLYFLSASTAGLLTTTETSTAGQVSKPILLATSTTSGIVLMYRGMIVGEDYYDFSEIADPGAPGEAVVRLFATSEGTGKSLISLDEDLHAATVGTSSHVYDAITVTDAGGLNITWAAGVVYDNFATDMKDSMVTIAAEGSNQAQTAVTMNWLYYDQSATDVAQSTTESSIDFGDGDFPVAAIGTSNDDIIYLDHYKVGSRDTHNIKHVLFHAFQAMVTEGCIVSEHAGDNAFDVDCTSGNYIHIGYDIHDVTAIDSTVTDIVRWFHDASNNWDTDTNSQIDAANWDDIDDSSGVIANNAARYYRSTFYIVGDVIHWLYPQEEFVTVNGAINGSDPTPPDVLTHFPKSTSVIMKGNDAAFPAAGTDQWIDVRPILGQIGTAGGSITDHGNLSGLTDDDHTQYILHSLATAANDFLVASGSGAYVKKTLAETGAILEADINHDNLVGFVANEHIDWTNASDDFKTDGTIKLKMRAAAEADESDYGQIWVKDNSGAWELWFTDESGTDTNLIHNEGYSKAEMDSFGYWQFDASEDYMPVASNADRWDPLFELDGNNDITMKEHPFFAIDENGDIQIVPDA